MNADVFRQVYDYHFTENRKIWDSYIIPLTQEQFIQQIDYSVGSVQNQVIHLVNVDDVWFSPLRGFEVPEWLEPDDFEDWKTILAPWDSVEQRIRDYLATLRDDMLFDKPFPEGEDEDLILWQVLFHVVNHGTDHRAQLLRLLSDLGVDTGPQDFVFYAYKQV